MNKIEKEPLVSIACITYNQDKYIRQCLDGFVMQKTNFKFEIVIHDDASTDNTPSIIREYCDRYPDLFVPILQTQNKYREGKGILIPYVYPRCKGKYIALCEGDDYWIDPLKLQKQVDFLEENPDYVFSYTNYLIDSDSMGGIVEVNSKSVSGNICKYLLTRNNPIITASVCIRRTIVESYMLEHNRYEIKMLMGDLPLWIYASKEGMVHYLNERTTVYRLLSESASHTSDYLKMQKFMRNALEIKLYFNKLYNLDCSEKQIIKKYYSILLIHMSKYSQKALLGVISECWYKYPLSFLNIKVIYYVFKRMIFNK